MNARRRRRWTPRDELVAKFLSEQWIADFATLMLLLGTRRSRTYKLMEKWRDDFGAVHSDSLRPRGKDRAVTWVWATQGTATRCLGYEASAWVPRSTNLTHKGEVSRVRAALVGLETGVWVPERLLLREAARKTPGLFAAGQASLLSQFSARPHVHDGRYFDGERWWAVEVELTLKTPSARLLISVLAAYRTLQNGHGLLYVYATDRIGNALDSAIKELIRAKKLPRSPGIRLRRLSAVIARRSIELPASSAGPEEAVS
ncbi:hypothetical protein [Nocardia sp. CS682]|uniref:hypothetical protein n=1 Tax=Nocardia sp. CS682 TaxID=1047172 RepID=UPI001074BB7E|nr:hypothetical protein [Nocardia sp. CS682]